jgi:hypothetical protein
MPGAGTSSPEAFHSTVRANLAGDYGPPGLLQTGVQTEEVSAEPDLMGRRGRLGEEP